MKTLAALMLSLLAASAGAVMPHSAAKDDAKRFSAYHQRRVHDAAALANADKAAYDFNNKRGMRPSAAGEVFSRGVLSTQARAMEFINEARGRLGIDPAALTLEREAGAAGHKHLLYRQNYKGVPVEFSYVKVHIADNGALIGIDANYTKGLKLNPIPAISAAQAAGLLASSGALAPDEGTLVVLPDPTGGPARLAWKFSAHASGSRWSYYVDALAGAVLFRHPLVRNACGTSGNMSAMIYDLDPVSGPLQVRPLANMTVYQADFNSSATTDINGNYCGTGVGKVFTGFQGPYVRINNFRGPSAHYDNGSGTWSTIATALSSPHPYPLNSVLISTIDLRGIVPPNAVKIAPVFNNFNVGQIDSVNGFGEGGDIIVDDQVTVLDSSGNPVASYLGNRGTFTGAGVAGQLYYLRLKSGAQPTTATGFDVVTSSFLTLSNPFIPGTAASQSHVWVATDTYIGLRSEFNLFYHLNLMHDFFMFGTAANGVSLYGNDTFGNRIQGVDISSAAYIGYPMRAMAFVGPNISNPFYDPTHDDIVFGDVSGTSPTDYLTDDATVPHHEYTHFVVEKIWSFPNFGEAGAISEADADYFSASSLNHAEIGRFVVEVFGAGNTPIRELDSAGVPDLCGPVPAILNNNTWQGEIHCDGRFISQAAWDIRKARVALQGLGPGRACADGLVFQTLLFFPESFQEYVTAMLKVDSMGLVPACAVNACGGNPVNCVQATIAAAFNNHGVQSVGGTNDPYDTLTSRNDSFETAVDVATIPVVSGTIFPAGDQDFFTFPAGAGPLTTTMTLPVDANNPGLHKGYMLTLYDHQHVQVAQASPVYDGVGTTAGFCGNLECTTSASNVTIGYNNPAAGQMFVEVSGGPTASGGSNSGVTSLSQYNLSFQYQPAGAINGSVVSATFDKDVIGYNVVVTTWLFHQDIRFAFAQLRDQVGNIIPNTPTHFTLQAGDFLAALTNTDVRGTISGTLQLQKGFAARFPSLGTVQLEVFGYNTYGSTVSLGLSVPFNLTADRTALTAFNNVFSPTAGQSTVIKYETLLPGRISLKLYTLGGTFVTTLLDADMPAGKGAINWSGVNINGRIVASGVYLLYMKGPGISQVQKIVIVK